MSDVPHFDPNPARPTKGWFGRNWLWFVPLLGLSSFCFCCLGCGGIIFGVLQTIKSSEPYQMALAHVQADPEVRELLGEPIVESGFMPLGQVNVLNDAGDATFSFNVSGPKKEASVNASAIREGGQWRLTSVEVSPTDGSSSPIVWPPEADWHGPLDESDMRRADPADEETGDTSGSDPTENEPHGAATDIP